MSNPYFQESAIFLINAVFGLYCTFVLLRFLLQLVHANFYNPISQFILKVTQPLVRPLRRVIPGIWGIDLASLSLVYLLKVVQIFLVFLAAGQMFSLGSVFVLALTDVFALILDIYVVSILAEVIMSWLGPDRRHEIFGLLSQLNAPVLDRIRRYVPPYSGMDFSPLLALLLIHLAKILLLGPLTHMSVT